MYKGITLQGHIMDVMDQFKMMRYGILKQVLQREMILPMKDQDANRILNPTLDKLVKQKQLLRYKSQPGGFPYADVLHYQQTNATRSYYKTVEGA